MAPPNPNSPRRKGDRARLTGPLPAACAIATAGLVSLSCDTTSPPSPPPQNVTSQAPEPPPEDNHFAITSGSSVALSADGASLFVADEDHQAIFVVPASFRDPGATRIVSLPGPPAQIVASRDVVLVTIRTLPTDDARPAYEALRGPIPEPSAIRRLPTMKLAPAPRSQTLRHAWVEKEYAPLLDSSIEELPDRDEAHHIFLPLAEAVARSLAPPGKKPPPDKAYPANKPSSDKAPPANKAPSDKASPNKASPNKASQDKPSRPRNTPAVPLDPNLLRKSRGGLLLAFRPDPKLGLVEISRTVTAPDAWGIGVTPDGKRAVVTSAWSAHLTVIDLDTHTPIFEADVPREPRGVSITPDGKTAWISHLVGTDLTRMDDLDTTPHITIAPLPAGLSRIPFGATLSASLGYANTLSPDGRYLYVPRHAIGAEGVSAWWGAPVIDVLDTRTGEPTIPLHVARSPSAIVADPIPPNVDWAAHPGQAPMPEGRLTQPRAVVYRKKTDTLLVASEGWDSLAEVDARAPDPAMVVVRSYDIADIYDAFGNYPVRGGAPTSVTLSEDEDTAIVFCRTTFDLVKIHLPTRKSEWLRLAEDALPHDAALGRRLFTNARSPALSGGIGCSGCHPDGRDDGYVWREGNLDISGGTTVRFLGLRANAKRRFGWGERDPAPAKLFPRQTPLIAGRVRSPGPYGWHAEARTLADRLAAGTALHRGSWESTGDDGGEAIGKIDDLMDYLRSGLVPPPTLARPLTPEEERGKAVFEGEARCADCHKPDAEHTDRTLYTLPATATRFGFDEEENAAFRTPSLRFLAGTAPFYHDGTADTLEALVAKNGNRMGRTLALSTFDRAALVAYLKTL